MTAKQYTGLLALSCVIASPFVANQWLKFAKAQHAYQEQLANEQKAAQEEQARLQQERAAILRELEERAKDEERAKAPIQKEWMQFEKDVQFLRSSMVTGTNDVIWCDRMLEAIQIRT
jgi:hypothetical protein